ncbi:MAG TPA: hypothetical protein VG838_13720 [Opitutaceae bacterium]|nr:hypothetical protein [Opitutaceae bacterium]
MHRLRILVPAIGCWLAVAAASRPARAADGDDRKTGNDVISATRGDLEALKTDRLLPSDPKLALPSFETPALSVPTPAPAPLLPQDASPEKAGQSGQGKSRTWLIDAMEKNFPESSTARGQGQDRNGRTRTDATKSDRDLDLLGLAGDAKTGGRATDPAEQGAAARQEPARSSVADVKDAPNPLQGFMAGWMTPRDFNLLLKPDAPGGAPALAAPPGENPGQSFTSMSVPASAPGGLLPGLDAPANPPVRAPVENPYLQPIALPPSGPAMLDLGPPPPPVVMRPPPSAAAPEPEPEKPAPAFTRPELQKRDDDAKYFPQLKHF